MDINTKLISIKMNTIIINKVTTAKRESDNNNIGTCNHKIPQNIYFAPE